MRWFAPGVGHLHQTGLPGRGQCVNAANRTSQQMHLRVANLRRFGQPLGQAALRQGADRHDGAFATCLECVQDMSGQRLVSCTFEHQLGARWHSGDRLRVAACCFERCLHVGHARLTHHHMGHGDQRAAFEPAAKRLANRAVTDEGDVQHVSLSSKWGRQT